MALSGAPTFDPIALIKKYGGAVGLLIGKNQSIYAQGDLAAHIFYIQKGQIQLTVASAEGKEAIIAVLEAGEFRGEGGLVGEPLRMFSATALTDCVVARLEKAAALRAIHENPSFSEY